MLFLALAIFGSGVIPVIFRAYEGWRVNLFWAIPVNYFTCVVIGDLLAGQTFDAVHLASQSWIGFAALQGLLLAVNFFLLAHTAQRAGVAIAALASRLSVAIPSLLAFSLYGDSMSFVKVAGLSMALLALYLCTAPDGNNRARTSRMLQLSPITLFLTFGCYFTVLKYLQTYYLAEASYHSYVMSGFVFALATSIIIGLSKGVFKRGDFHLHDLGAGIFLGLINYLAIYALLKVLALKGWQTSQIFPIYSVGVVVFAALLAAAIFKEKFSRRKMFGLAIGILAVALLNR